MNGRCAMQEAFQPKAALPLPIDMILLFAAMWSGLYLKVLLPWRMTAF
jgi:hypothetical protein